MPTTKPRIGLTLSDDLFDLVCEVANETGRSNSGLVAELIEDQRPALEAIRESYAEEHKMNRELSRRFGERAAMTFQELRDTASARPTRTRQAA